MSVLFVEGFTGFPRETGINSANSSLLTGGYLLPTTVNDNSGSYPTGSGYSIVPDPIFADRNLLRMQQQNTSSVVEEGINVSYGATPNPAKVVLGFTVTMTTEALAKYLFSLLIGSAYSATNPQNAMMYTSAGAGRTRSLMTEVFAAIDFNNPATASPNAGILVPGNAASAAAVPFTPNVQHHIELLLEQDVNRIRMYLDGVLVGDAAFPGTLANMNTGFCIALRKQVSGTKYADIGNIYALAVDAVHTGPLGPAARVLEVAPNADAAVQWQRDETKYASNTAVVSQNYNNTDFVSAMDAGTTDLFSLPPSVGANAAQIYGVGIKVAAKSLTDATHAIKATVKVNGVSLDSTEAALPIGGSQVFVRDASINPNTNAIWKPAEVSAGQFGYKLSK